MDKKCQICEVVIPDDFVNPLCLDCYKKLEEEKIKKEKEEIMEKEAKKTPEEKEEEIKDRTINEPIQGIADPDYKINEEKDDKEQWKANISQFGRSGKLLWHPTRNMYEFIKDWCIQHIQEHPQYGTEKFHPKFVWKPKIVDVGCGIGVGSNILSQEADFVWGIDKNENSIKFAKEAFTRNKNGFYYSSQVTFDQFDVMTDPREARNFMKFDVVVAIEIIEHIENAEEFLRRITNWFEKFKTGYEATTYFISTPNRNNPKINDENPKNKYHVREWTSQEFNDLLKKYFSKIEILNNKGVEVGVETIETPILAKCQK